LQSFDALWYGGGDLVFGDGLVLGVHLENGVIGSRALGWCECDDIFIDSLFKVVGNANRNIRSTQVQMNVG
jgi:hypothetical protein